MTPERLAEIRRLNNHYGIGMKTTRANHVTELLAEVDRLRAQVAAVEGVLEEGDHGLFCDHHYGNLCNCWNAKVARITGYGYES